MAGIKYSGQRTSQDGDADVVKHEKTINDRARAAANAHPEADLASAAKSANGDNDHAATVMD